MAIGGNIDDAIDALKEKANEMQAAAMDKVADVKGMFSNNASAVNSKAKVMWGSVAAAGSAANE